MRAAVPRGTGKTSAIESQAKSEAKARERAGRARCRAERRSGACDAGGQGGANPRPKSAPETKTAAIRRNPYLDVLRSDGALAFSSAAMIGRMSMSMYGLGTVLLIATLTGRYGLAGTVAAAGSVGYALATPVAAKLADRFGQGRVLSRQGVLFAVCTTVFIASVELRAPVWALLVTGVLAGASMPSLGSMVRARWSALIGDDERRLHAAFSLESVIDELIFVIGPALVTLLATQLLPASGIGTAALLCVCGTLLFAAQRRTEPVPRTTPRRAETAGVELPLQRLASPQPGSSRPTDPHPEPPRTGSLSLSPRPGNLRVAGSRPRTFPLLTRLPGLPRLPTTGLITLAPAFLLLGSMFASVDLSTVAFATERGLRPVAGLVLGTIAFGSGIGGLWYGSRHWRAPLGHRFTVTAAVSVLGISTFWAMPGLLALTAVGFTAGLWIAPTLIAGYAILDAQAPPDRRTESMAWLSSTVSVGVALGSAITGHLIDAHGARLGFGFAATCGICAVLVTLAGHRKLRTPGSKPAKPAN